jgi:hypothetical protein
MSHQAMKLYNLAQTCAKRSNWAIIMLGGGHFAAAIFDGNLLCEEIVILF